MSAILKFKDGDDSSINPNIQVHIESANNGFIMTYSDDESEVKKLFLSIDSLLIDLKSLLGG